MLVRTEQTNPKKLKQVNVPMEQLKQMDQTNTRIESVYEG